MLKPAYQRSTLLEHMYEVAAYRMSPELLTIVSHGAEASLLAKAIELIDEEDAGSVVSRSLEHVPHPRCPNAHKHLHEFCSCCSVEGHACFTCYGLCQQGLTCNQRQRSVMLRTCAKDFDWPK